MFRQYNCSSPSNTVVMSYKNTNVIATMALVFNLLLVAVVAFTVPPKENHRRIYKASFLDDFKANFEKTFSGASEDNYPKVSVPDNFEIPEPKPLTVTRSSEIPSLLKSSVALALRLGTGAFVLG